MPQSPPPLLFQKKYEKSQFLPLQSGKLKWAVFFLSLISELRAVWEQSAMAQHVNPCQVLQFSFLCVGGISPQRWIKLKILFSRPLPKMINPCREYYGVLSGCAFLLPVIVLFLLLASSVSLLFIWKEEKNAWIEEGAFPTVTQLGKIRHCHRVPIPVPCWTVHRGWQTAFLIEWPFFTPFEKWWRS